MSGTGFAAETGATPAVGVTIVMPCLNEAPWLGACIANARDALDLIRHVHGLTGEIVVADNGSTDASRDVAQAHGARVVPVQERGYGAALSGGARAARGRYIVMGDADGSYDFRDAVAMIARLRAGADLCMGSRLEGTIDPGAMPWKNRYIGNPVLTFILNLFFGARVGDAHCGLRAMTRECLAELRLTGRGMEFASEMIIKAALKGQRIDEVPASLHRDLRDRPPHLRPWRDGWRHLRYLLMLSPSSVFGVPAALAGLLSCAILAYATYVLASGQTGRSVVGNYWVILAGAMLGVSHVTGLLAAATHLYGVREGYRRQTAASLRLSRWISLESMLLSGLGAVVAGLAILASVVAYWSAASYGPMANVLPAVLGTSLVVIGVQNALGGFLLAILSGNEADFLQPVRTDTATRTTEAVEAQPEIQHARAG
jgi:glycosyltransferase involved in cell wall biosynthesis